MDSNDTIYVIVVKNLTACSFSSSIIWFTVNHEKNVPPNIPV